MHNALPSNHSHSYPCIQLSVVVDKRVNTAYNDTEDSFFWRDTEACTMDILTIIIIII